MNDWNETVLPHHFRMENRETLHLTGVTDVKCFDEEMVDLVTTVGDLSIFGSGLHIAVLRLETGDLHVEGKVDSIQYKERLTRRGKIGRLFR